MSKPVDLSQIKIATPCPADWNKMKGDERVRFCGDCKLNVYSSAGLTQEEVMDLVRRRQMGERICMQLHKRADGTLITKDCPVGVSLAARMKRRMMALRFAMISLISGVLLVSQRSLAMDSIMGGAIIAPDDGPSEEPAEVPAEGEPEEDRVPFSSDFAYVKKVKGSKAILSGRGLREGDVYVIHEGGRRVAVLNVIKVKGLHALVTVRGQENLGAGREYRIRGVSAVREGFGRYRSRQPTRPNKWSK